MEKKLLTKTKIVLLFFFSLFELFNVPVHAQVPNPKVPCGTSSDPEFHSLRPYQASPCGDSDKILYCGNDILIYETATHTETSFGDDSACELDDWLVNKYVDKTYEIALKDLELPILGNTQDVKNSQNADPGFDDATKVNEYVSWYLSGANSKAETGTSTNDQIINYSGPIQKLFPSAVQDFERKKTIESVTKTVTYDDTDAGTQTDPKTTTTSEPANHDQIVVCANKNILGVFGHATPHECYSGNDSPAKDEYKLSKWNGDLGLPRKLSNEAINFLNSIPGIGNLVNNIATNAWNKRIPPLPWDDGTGKAFKSDLFYQKAYNEWRGKSCLIIPVVNKLLCFENPGVTNEYADLYQYVPLANTSDKNAKVVVDRVEVREIQGTVLSVDKPASHILEEPALFFAHTQEDAQLSSLLQTSYNPQEGTSEDVDPLTTEPLKDEKNQCRVINVRTNEGDDLFPEVEPDSYRVKVNPYYIQTIPKKGGCNYRYNERFQTDVWTQNYEGGVTVKIVTQTKTPYAEEIYKNTVAASDSIFRKIFPKIGPGAPISCIANIPTYSNATYEIVGGTDAIQVQEPDGTKTDGTGSKLYFPYIGSVYEYFLKGIQTALRPKGYGQQIVNGDFCKPPTPNKCKINVPDSAVPSKFLGAFKTNFIDVANRWSTKCPGADFNLADECYNYVVSESQKAKINPAFTLTIWLNESDASNYCHGGPTTQDFGIGGQPQLWQNFTEQLRVFLLQPAAFKSCASTPGWIEPMQAFLSRFRSSSGSCNPADPDGIEYYNGVLAETWPIVAGPKCVKNGKFAITWPTDMSCP